MTQNSNQGGPALSFVRETPTIIDIVKHHFL